MWLGEIISPHTYLFKKFHWQYMINQQQHHFVYILSILDYCCIYDSTFLHSKIYATVFIAFLRTVYVHSRLSILLTIVFISMMQFMSVKCGWKSLILKETDWFYFIFNEWINWYYLIFTWNLLVSTFLLQFGD